MGLDRLGHASGGEPLPHQGLEIHADAVLRPVGAEGPLGELPRYTAPAPEQKRASASAERTIGPVGSLRAGLVPAIVTSGPFARDDETTGIFEGHQDVGDVKNPGSVVFDKAAGTYTVTGSGANMWAARDAFHYAWKRTSGDRLVHGRYRLRRPGQGAASQGVPGHPPGPRRRLGLRRRRAPRRRPHVAAIPRFQGRPDARGPGERLGAEAAAAREEREICPPLRGHRRRPEVLREPPCGSSFASRSMSDSASARTTRTSRRRRSSRTSS